MKPNTVAIHSLLSLAAAVATTARADELSPGETVLVSRNDIDVSANDDSYLGAISGNGRFVAFQSAADNLAPLDTGGHPDVFLHDLAKDTLVLISRTASGTSGNDESGSPSLSKNGRFTAFWSKATDLVPGDSNGIGDIFVFDKKSATIERVSVATGGIQSNGSSSAPRISADGRFVAFESYATNLVAGDVNANRDVFVHDRKSGTTERVSIGGGDVESNGTSATPAISASGRFVAFWSNGTNFDASIKAGVFVRDRKKGITNRVSITEGGLPVPIVYSDSCSISANGRLATFAAALTGTTADDTSNVWDVFVRDVKSGTTELVSLGETGVVADGDCLHHTISGNGRFVAFSSPAKSLAGDTTPFKDVFVRDRKSDVTKRVTLGMAGDGASNDTGLSGISDDGRIVVFESPAKNLVSTSISGWQTFARRW